MQATKHNEQVCTPIQLKLNTIVDNTTIALKSQLNALFADLLVESEEYNETKSILLTLPIVKKLISASAYVAALNQADADQAPPSPPINISQTCTFNYDSLNHITPPIIDEDENEDTQEKENTEDEQEEEEEPTIKESLTVMEPPDVKEAITVIDEPSLSTEEVKENICLEIIEPEDEEDEDEDAEDEDEEDEQEDEPSENNEEQDDEVEQEAVEVVVEAPNDEQEEDAEQDDDEEEVEEQDEDDDEEEVEEDDDVEVLEPRKAGPSSFAVKDIYVNRASSFLETAFEQIEELQERLDNAVLKASSGAMPFDFSKYASPVLERIAKNMKSLPKAEQVIVRQQVGVRVQQLYQEQLASLRDYYGRLFESILGRGDSTKAHKHAVDKVLDQFRKAATAAVPVKISAFGSLDLEYLRTVATAGLKADLQQLIELQEEAVELDSDTEGKMRKQSIPTWYKKLASRGLVLGINYFQAWLAWQGIKRAALQRERVLPKFPLF
jgi:hypothetical protein